MEVVIVKHYPDSDLVLPDNPWRAILRRSLCDTPGLVWIFPDGGVPGATLWRATRGWVECYRAQRVAPGDRILLVGVPDLGWVGAMLAGLWLEATLVPMGAREDPEALAEQLDARFVVGPGADIAWDRHGQPQVHATARAVRGPGRPDVRFLLQTSGTGGKAKWHALSNENIIAVLGSHVPVLGLGPTHRMLSTLPWSHAFGLVLECLAALWSGASLVRSASPADAVEHVRLMQRWTLDWWCAVPAMVRRLAHEPGGLAALRALRGGIVGGAMLTTEACAVLAGTRLRVGYGQTEASPGIMLGEEGEFAPALLGRPVGCAVRLGSGGVIEFSGANACLGRWPLSDASPGALGSAVPGGDWRDTGDLGRREGDVYFFEGRRDDLVRLDNGRTLSALEREAWLRARFPAVGEVMLWSSDGQNLRLVFTGEEPPRALLTEWLGSLASRLQIGPRVAMDAWRFTSKGELDRVALRARLLDPLG